MRYMIIEKIIQDEDAVRIERRSRMMILLSGGLSAAFSVVLLIVAARTVSLKDTGILTIAFAIAKLLVNVGKYGMRTYQVTDTQDVRFTEWLCSRVITTGAMALCTAGYVAYQTAFHGYSAYKAAVVSLLCLIYAGECVEDVYTGYYQKMGRLDVASLIQALRYIVLYAAFAACLLLTHDLLLASLVGLVLMILAVWFWARGTLRYFVEKAEKPRWNVIKKLLVDCFPLFLMSFVLIYMANAPKYAIDSIYDADIQAYFGFVSMPIFAISLLSGFIFQPKLATLAQNWKAGNKAEFHRIVKRQLLAIGGMILFCLALGWLAGIPVLSVLYHTDELEAYKGVFLILLLGGGGTAVINFLSAVLVIFRQQKAVLYGHVAAGACIFLTISPVIRRGGLESAVWDTAIFTWILAALLMAFYLRDLQKLSVSDAESSRSGE